MAIVLVGAVFVFQIFQRDAAAQMSDGEISVQSASLVVTASSGNGTALLSITVENSGSKPVTEVLLSVNNVQQPTASCPAPAPPAPPVSPTFCVGAGAITQANSLAPNQLSTATGTPVLNPRNALMHFVADQSYPYSVEVTFSDGSTYVVGGSLVAGSS